MEPGYLGRVKGQDVGVELRSLLKLGHWGRGYAKWAGLGGLGGGLVGGPIRGLWRLTVSSYEWFLSRKHGSCMVTFCE